jgi:hypothetical protein
MKISFFTIAIDLILIAFCIGAIITNLQNYIIVSVFGSLLIGTTLKLNYGLTKYYKQKGW